MPWAEVIGDPIAHSKSPAVHAFWLNAMGIDGDYCATRVPPDGLACFFAARRADPAWRGCNVTAPHKLAVIPFLDRLSGAAEQTGAVNCIICEGGTLTGFNTDVNGIREALSETDLNGRKAVLIGAGGAARAALTHLIGERASEIFVLARDPNKAARSFAPARDIRTMSAEAIAGAGAVINASPLGMIHAGGMPVAMLAALTSAAPGGTAFDMVYDPLDTEFLQSARRHGLRTVDGLTMLIGQAREAFRLLFGAAPPNSQDAALRVCLGVRLAPL